MPTYDYKCLNCENKFELFQKMSDDPIEKCPVCGGQVKRLVGGGLSPIFKGKGFYQTDYKNSGSASSTGVSKTEKKEEVKKKPE